MLKLVVDFFFFNKNYLLQFLIGRLPLMKKCNFTFEWLVVGLRPNVLLTWACRGSVIRGGLSKGSQPVFRRVSEKNKNDSERLARQTRPGIKPGTSCLPALSVEPLRHWWGQRKEKYFFEHELKSGYWIKAEFIEARQTYQ